MEPEGSLPYSQAPATCPYPEPLWTIRDMIRFYGEELLTSPNPQAGEQPLVGCPRLLIQYIRSYPPSATCGRAMLWWQTPTCHGLKKILVRNTEGYISPKFVSVCKYLLHRSFHRCPRTRTHTQILLGTFTPTRWLLISECITAQPQQHIVTHFVLYHARGCHSSPSCPYLWVIANVADWQWRSQCQSANSRVHSVVYFSQTQMFLLLISRSVNVRICFWGILCEVKTRTPYAEIVSFFALESAPKISYEYFKNFTSEASSKLVVQCHCYARSNYSNS